MDEQFLKAPASEETLKLITSSILKSNVVFERGMPLDIPTNSQSCESVCCCLIGII